MPLLLPILLAYSFVSMMPKTQANETDARLCITRAQAKCFCTHRPLPIMLIARLTNNHHPKIHVTAQQATTAPAPRSAFLSR